MFRKATPKDLNRISAIYEELHTAQEQGRIPSIGWKREVYPTATTANEAINAGDMFVEEADGTIVASARINKIQVAEYSEVKWKYPADDNEVMVLHTLAVSPSVRRNGYGTKFVEFYESYAIENGCRYLRMDTWENNAIARSLYKKLGYTEVGTIVSQFNGIKNFRLVCLEKRLW